MILLGFNLDIMFPMNVILYYEKVVKSFHLTPWQTYEEADKDYRNPFSTLRLPSKPDEYLGM